MKQFCRIAVTIALLSPSQAWSFLAAEERRPPNIVFLLIDDLGWPDVGCYGHRFHRTPRIDELAHEGVRFTDFYAATPVCSSTRSTIQTGQYSARTGITDFIAGHWRPFAATVVPTLETHLQPGVRTIGHQLRQVGYTTAYFGKWHLGRTPRHHPENWGYQMTEKQLGEGFTKWLGDKPAGPKKMDLLTEQTLFFIERHKDALFFVTLSHHAVHIPLEANAATVAKYQHRTPPSDGVNNVAYAAMMEDLDRSIGRIIDRLKELKLDDNTVIVFTSDNGGLRLTFTGVGDIVSTNYPLRDEKGSLYEGGIRVPMIVRWPGVVPPGTQANQPTTTADLLPTFCTLAGARLPNQIIDGADLVPLLRDPASRLAREAIYFHYPHYHHSRPASAIRLGDWKLIEYLADGEVELYNLAGDVVETTNLAALHPMRTRRMREKLVAWRESINARMPTPNPDYAPDRAQEWGNRRTGKPIDVEALRRRYETRAPRQ